MRVSIAPPLASWDIRRRAGLTEVPGQASSVQSEVPILDHCACPLLGARGATARGGKHERRPRWAMGGGNGGSEIGSRMTRFAQLDSSGVGTAEALPVHPI